MAERRAVRRRQDDDTAEDLPEQSVDGEEGDEGDEVEPAPRPRSRRRRDDDEFAQAGPRPRSRPRRDDDDAEEGGTRPRSRRRAADGGLTAVKAAQMGLRQIAELTGKQPEGITGVERTDDGWIVGAEVVEDRRIPSSTDILATYETELDTSGELLSYRRVRRYSRGRGDSSEDS